MDILRTDTECFNDLPDFNFVPQYVDVPDADYGSLRMHYIDEGPQDAPVVLMLHGEPSWSFAYRHVIAAVYQQGFRAVAPDHIGFGRSDKLRRRGDYSYRRFVEWMIAFVEELDLRAITLVCQDWGGPIGLSVLASMPDRFDAVVAANTLLPNCQEPPAGVTPWPGEVIDNWISMTAAATDLPVGDIIESVSTGPLPAAVKAAYDAPFPDASYKGGVLQFPSLIPVDEQSPGCAENRLTWEFLEQWHKPFVTAFSDSDPTTRDWAGVFQRRVPGAAGSEHPVIAGAGHFVQEEQGEVLAAVILDVLRS